MLKSCKYCGRIHDSQYDCGRKPQPQKKITYIETDYDRRLDDDNLLTVCGMHHEMCESGAIPYEVVKQIIDEQEEAS